MKRKGGLSFSIKPKKMKILTPGVSFDEGVDDEIEEKEADEKKKAISERPERNEKRKGESGNSNGNSNGNSTGDCNSTGDLIEKKTDSIGGKNVENENEKKNSATPKPSCDENESGSGGGNLESEGKEIVEGKEEKDEDFDQAVVDHLAEYVVRNGIQFEKLAKIKNPDNPKFRFLYDVDSKSHKYYLSKKKTIQAQQENEQGVLPSPGLPPTVYPSYQTPPNQYPTQYLQHQYPQQQYPQQYPPQHQHYPPHHHQYPPHHQQYPPHHQQYPPHHHQQYPPHHQQYPPPPYPQHPPPHQPLPPYPQQQQPPNYPQQPPVNYPNYPNQPPTYPQSQQQPTYPQQQPPQTQTQQPPQTQTQQPPTSQQQQQPTFPQQQSQNQRTRSPQSNKGRDPSSPSSSPRQSERKNSSPPPKSAQGIRLVSNSPSNLPRSSSSSELSPSSTSRRKREFLSGWGVVGSGEREGSIGGGVGKEKDFEGKEREEEEEEKGEEGVGCLLQENKHHIADYLPKEQQVEFSLKLAQSTGSLSKEAVDVALGNSKLQEERKRKEEEEALSLGSSNVGFHLMTKMGWQEGKGLGSNEQGTVDLVGTTVKVDKVGVGGQQKKESQEEEEDIFSMYKARMSQAYKHRPNPFGNPRIPY